MRLVRAVEENGVFILGLAEHPDGSGASLIFTRAELDETQALDVYSLSVHDADGSYSTESGGIESCELSECELRLAFTEAAADAHGLPEVVSFRLILGESTLTVLQRDLRRIGLPI